MTSILRSNCLAAGAALCFATTASAAPRPALLELFTSEGCSSCPPAEAYIGELAQRHDVLALAFHVSYWDDLGWKDRFGLSEGVARQRIYAQNLHRSSVYTPEVVIDGRSDYSGNDRAGINKALSAARTGVPVEISVRGDEVLVELGEQSRVAPSDVVLVAYLREAVAAIGRGENAGRTFQEFNIVRAVRNLGRWDGKVASFRARSSGLPRDATDVAALIQPLGQAQVIGVATHPLQAPSTARSPT